MDKGGGSITGLRQFFLFHSAKKFRSGTLLCFRFFGVSKKIMPKRGMTRFSVENLLSHGAENFRIGTL